MSRELRVFLALTFGWTWLVGAALYVADVQLTGVTGLAVLALLYMPSPLVAALGQARAHRAGHQHVARRPPRAECPGGRVPSSPRGTAGAGLIGALVGG